VNSGTGVQFSDINDHRTNRTARMSGAVTRNLDGLPVRRTTAATIGPNASVSAGSKVDRP
jgi:hypothetical protein